MTNNIVDKKKLIKYLLQKDTKKLAHYIKFNTKQEIDHVFKIIDGNDSGYDIDNAHNDLIDNKHILMFFKVDDNELILLDVDTLDGLGKDDVEIQVQYVIKPIAYKLKQY